MGERMEQSFPVSIQPTAVSINFCLLREYLLIWKINMYINNGEGGVLINDMINYEQETGYFFPQTK